MRIDASLATRLVASQFPHWARLPITPVEFGGVDNRTFHLGDDMSVRLPSGEGYAAQPAMEQRWLPFLAPHLPLPIPTPLAMGVPGEGYPFDWSVYRWLDGDAADHTPIDNLTEFAESLAEFIAALQRVDPTDGPPPGQHNYFRGASPEVYHDETLRAIQALGNDIPGEQCLTVWDAALASPWTGSPVWFHGDVAAGNLLVESGRLSAVIDFGVSGVGDPAVDTIPAWTMFSGVSRAAFRAALPLDDAAWARGRGWVLWKALIALAGARDPARPAESHRIIAEVLADHEASR